MKLILTMLKGNTLKLSLLETMVGFGVCFIYLFLAVLGLCFCARAFSSCGKQGPLFNRGVRASHYRGLSCCGAQAPDAQAQ